MSLVTAVGGDEVLIRLTKNINVSSFLSQVWTIMDLVNFSVSVRNHVLLRFFYFFIWIARPNHRYLFHFYYNKFFLKYFSNDLPLSMFTWAACSIQWLSDNINNFSITSAPLYCSRSIVLFKFHSLTGVCLNTILFYEHILVFGLHKQLKLLNWRAPICDTDACQLWLFAVVPCAVFGRFVSAWLCWPFW